MKSIRTVIVGSTIVLVVASTASSASAAFPGGNGDIAFARSSRGQVDIWVVRPGATGAVPSR